jgi:hypothetical protein
VASAGTITPQSHTYASTGPDTASITITDADSNLSNTATFGVTVAASTTPPPVDVLTAVGATLFSTEGSRFSGTVAAFADTNTAATPATFTATINWGDGSPVTAGTIVSVPGGFDVLGTHSYADFGTYTTSISIVPANGSTANANGIADIADAALTAGTSPISRHAIPGAPTGSVVIGSFADADPNAVAGDYIGTINWGDGQTTALTASNFIITGHSGGTQFNVLGSHTYATKGTYDVTIQITDDDGNPLKTGGSTVTIDEAKFIVAAAPPHGHPVCGRPGKERHRKERPRCSPTPICSEPQRNRW